VLYSNHVPWFVYTSHNVFDILRTVTLFIAITLQSSSPAINFAVHNAEFFENGSDFK
jgi:hypothetical protein